MLGAFPGEDIRHPCREAYAAHNLLERVGQQLYKIGAEVRGQKAKVLPASGGSLGNRSSRRSLRPTSRQGASVILKMHSETRSLTQIEKL